MDISGWTIEQRVRFPDWVFPVRQVISARIFNIVNNSYVWAISDIGLPDPCMIWKIGMLFRISDSQNNWMRMGLRDTVPTSEAEMNDSVEILPHWGGTVDAPEKIHLFIGNGVYLELDIRKPMATGGKKLVLEGRCEGNDIRVLVHLVVSGLPTDMAGWLAHNRV